MRKSVFAILFIALLTSLFFLMNPSVPQPTREEGGSTEVIEATPTPPPARPRWTRPVSQQESSRDQPVPEDYASIHHGPAEFALGELQNVVIENGIRLGNNPSFVPRSNPNYRLFGNYISPEQTSKDPFDLLNLNFQVAGLERNEVTFEIRTQGSDGFWSEWQEVAPEQMKEPLPVSMQASGWQYRLTLLANDATTSPTVETVSIEPINSKRRDFTANNAQ